MPLDGSVGCLLNDGGTCSPLSPGASCAPVTGQQFDESNGCVSMPKTIGCCAAPMGSTCTAADTVGCLTRADSTDGGGTVWRTSQGWSPPGFTACNDQLRARVIAAPSCGAAATDASTSPACVLSPDGICKPTTANTSCTPFSARPYDQAKACLSGTPRTVACCATEAGGACTAGSALGCVTFTSSGGTLVWFTSSLWSAPGFVACDDTLRQMVTTATACSP
jgi:hypothetical protein